MDYFAYLRQFRIGPFTIFDTVLSYLGAYILAPVLTKLAAKINISISRPQWLWLTLPIGVVAHALVDQDTPLTTMVLDPHGHIIAKLVLGFMLFMGLKGIRLGDTRQ